MDKKHKIFEYFGMVAPLIPVPLYWLNAKGVFLGGNELCLQVTGARSLDEFIGKNYEQIHPKGIAEELVRNINLVIETGKTIETEEVIKDLSTSKNRYFMAIRSPIRDENGIIVGVIATSIEITDKKEAERLRIENEKQKVQLQEQEKFRKIVDQAANDTKSPLAILLIIAQQCSGFTKEQVFEKLKTYASSVPINLYWLNVDNKIIGANKQTIEAIGGKVIEDYIGKTPYDLYSHEMADHIVKHNMEVMRIKKVLSQEEPIVDVTSGEEKYFMAFKAPLFDEKGNVIGIVGTSVNITAEKTAKHLVLENERQRGAIMEYEKFAAIAAQAAHDIRSPLTVLDSATKQHANELPEKLRISIRDSVIGVRDIANNLLSKYGKEEKEEKGDDEKEERQPTLLSLTLLQILSQKKYQYKDQLGVKFEHEFADGTDFVCIKVELSTFTRMISNLINNAVDAFDGKEGKVVLKLIADDIQAKIIIEDNGKGIPKDTLNKIKHNIAVTSGKEEGHGLGMIQVRKALKSNNGELEIESEVGKGTAITLTFPVTKVPEWLVHELCLSRGDTVIILDDDPSVHNAWEMRFKNYVDLIKVKHFTDGEKAIKFINSSSIDKDDMFLLTDYELLNQELHGLNVVERTQVPRSVLVTSHFTNLAVRSRVIETHTKILPKDLVAGLPIKIAERTATISVADYKEIDVVIVEDNNSLADSLSQLLNAHGKKTDVYYDGNKFLKNFEHYSKDTKICLDYSLGKITGVDIAEVLRDAGYTKLYLLTGWDRETLKERNVPDYLTIMLKDDTDQIIEVLSK